MQRISSHLHVCDHNIEMMLINIFFYVFQSSQKKVLISKRKNSFNVKSKIKKNEEIPNRTLLLKLIKNEYLHDD